MILEYDLCCLYDYYYITFPLRIILYLHTQEPDFLTYLFTVFL